MKGLIGLFLLATCISAVVSQLPPRLSIPGAIPVGGPGGERVQQFRNERLVPSPNVVRIRRPIARPQSFNSLPIQQTRTAPLIEDAKPVTEENEDLPEPFIPQIISSPPSQPSPPQALFTNEPSNYESDEALNQPQQQQQPQQAPPRFQPQERPAPQRVQPDRFAPIDIPSSGAQRFNTNTQPKPAPQRPRPVFREPPQQQIRQQQQQQQYQDESISAVRQAQRPIQSRPTHSHDDSQRERKPVAQILRKYREENEDGSITWGFENDDGSFKEEIIGIDCVTRGRYGYVDPDGLKREYNYETGILCDPNKRGQEEDDEDTKGYVDYQENKAVLPNGVRIDLTQMGKNKSKRPSQGGQQQQQQQQYYRN